ncbi:hypothetical protein [Mollivirus kamchatka]|nr:hypothetical protein [Mollivirus kamchatka]
MGTTVDYDLVTSSEIGRLQGHTSNDIERLRARVLARWEGMEPHAPCAKRQVEHVPISSNQEEGRDLPVHVAPCIDQDAASSLQKARPRRWSFFSVAMVIIAAFAVGLLLSVAFVWIYCWLSGARKRRPVLVTAKDGLQ